MSESYHVQFEAQLFVMCHDGNDEVGMVAVGTPERWTTVAGSDFHQRVSMSDLRTAAAGRPIESLVIGVKHIDTTRQLPTEAPEDQGTPDDGSWLFGDAVGEGLIDRPGSAF